MYSVYGMCKRLSEKCIVTVEAQIAVYRYYNEMMWPGRFASVVLVEETMEMLTGSQKL